MHKKQQYISMVSSSSSSPCTKLAAAGPKPPRSCDGCGDKTARWFCPADDAFLCQNCDLSVHSANPLAGKHQRVRLRFSSPPSSPSWDSGFTRKPRTPRNGKRGTHDKRSRSVLTKEFSHSSGDAEHALVPEVYSTSDENLRLYEGGEEEELVYRVPVIDPSVAEMCNSNIPVASRQDYRREKVKGYKKQRDINTTSQFATEVERLLLGKGVEEEEGEPLVLDMEGLGLLSNFTREAVAANDQNGAVCETDGQGNDDFGSENGGRKKRLLLKLDYEGVITAWADQRRPWSNAVNLDPKDCWLVDLTPGGRGEMEAPKRNRNNGVMDEEGRKERVYRYREKRQNRLFSKKIRYQVRKLNAERRPRIKGRFVKRPPLFDFPLPTPH